MPKTVAFIWIHLIILLGIYFLKLYIKESPHHSDVSNDDDLGTDHGITQAYYLCLTPDIDATLTKSGSSVVALNFMLFFFLMRNKTKETH